ncbi:MAG: transglutaminase domain-containing protein [Candidatus Bathyarchaeia archaeon]
MGVKRSPVIPYRFGEAYYVTQFIQPYNPGVLEAYRRCWNQDKDGLVENVAEYVKLNLRYPMDRDGQPLCQGEFKRFEFQRGMWLWRRSADYAWSLPGETLAQGWGICIDTANLAVSILRRGRVTSYVCLGAVYDSASEELLGYHAWARTWYRGGWWLIETTIHDPELGNMTTIGEAYKGGLSVKYQEEAHYNETGYWE